MGHKRFAVAESCDSYRWAGIGPPDVKVNTGRTKNRLVLAPNGFLGQTVNFRTWRFGTAWEGEAPAEPRESLAFPRLDGSLALP